VAIRLLDSLLFVRTTEFRSWIADEITRHELRPV
jgi:hypothetical protein